MVGLDAVAVEVVLVVVPEDADDDDGVVVVVGVVTVVVALVVVVSASVCSSKSSSSVAVSSSTRLLLLLLLLRSASLSTSECALLLCLVASRLRCSLVLCLGFGPRLAPPPASRWLSSKASRRRWSRMFSIGSHVLCLLDQPFHLTRYSTRPLLTLFFCMHSAAYTLSPTNESSMVYH